MVEFLYLFFTYMPGESYHGDLGLCCVCEVFLAPINSITSLLVYTSVVDLILFKIYLTFT